MSSPHRADRICAILRPTYPHQSNHEWQMDQLALFTLCTFASVAEGTPVSPDFEDLRFVVDVAQRV